MTDLPQRWREVALGEVAETQLGKMLNSKKQTGTAVMRYLRNVNLRWGGFDLSDVKEMDIFATEVERFTLKKGDLLICEGGEPGRCAVWNSDGVMAFQNAMHRVRPHAELSPWFLALQFEAKVRNGELEHLFSGVTIKHFSQQKLRAVDITLPPLAEQERIVEILEEQFSRLDSALASVKAVREKAQAFRRSLRHAAFSGELTGGTEGWREVALGDVAKWSSGGTPKSKDPRFYGGDIPWCVIGDLTEGLVIETAQCITEAGLNASSAKVVPEGTVMIAMYGASIGRVGIAAKPMATNQAIGCAVVDECKMKRWFLLHYLAYQKHAFCEAGQGAAQPNISQTLLKVWSAPIPPLPTQERIVSVLEEQFSRLDNALEVANQLEARIASERRSLLHSAFTGALTATWRETHV